MNPPDILRHFQARTDAMIDAIRELVDIESPSKDAASSASVAAWIEKSLEAISTDIDVERIPADGVGIHLVIRAFDGHGPEILLLGHTDTVHSVGTRMKNPTRLEDDKLYGCGVFDMKANIVVALEVLRFFFGSGARPSSSLKLVLSCDEEIGSRTGRVLVEREAAGSTSCLVLEPSADGNVKTGRKGTGMFTLRTHGVPAHAGLEPEKGASAVLELARHIEKLHGLTDLQRGTTVNVCTISGGTTSNVIPEHASCEIDVRFTTRSEADRVESAIRALQPYDRRVSLEITGEINRPPMERTADVVALFEKARILAASFDYDLGETQVGGASDGNFVAAMGVPVLDGLGVAGAGAHTLNEYIYIKDIAKRATLLTLLLS